MQTIKKYLIPMMLLTFFSFAVFNIPVTKTKPDYENVSRKDFINSIEKFNETFDKNYGNKKEQH